MNTIAPFLQKGICLYSGHQKHPVFNELRSMVKKALGADRILESMFKRLDNLERHCLLTTTPKAKKLVL